MTHFEALQSLAHPKIDMSSPLRQQKVCTKCSAYNDNIEYIVTSLVMCEYKQAVRYEAQIDPRTPHV